MNMDQYIGRLLDNRYEILEIIGTGGMAVVYKARCHRLNRLVAIKILKDEFSRDDEFRRRFHAEGEAVAMLSHPNIVQVYDVSSMDNANFMVMELVEGISLKQYMEKKGVLNWKETLHFAMQIAKGLEHAHSRGIVHRDIKPHNVMVLKNGSVKVMDFGIARVMSKSNTLTKEALGSVHYISPEQAKGGWVDNRSDLYSLSVVMYEMMTGRPPYDGESPVAVAIQHINGGAVMPSILNPNIPGGLEQIIMKGMALEVNERYASATDMLRDMDEFRKDPAIIFSFPKPTVSQATQQISLDDLHRKPMTTAERVAMSKGDAPRKQLSDTNVVRTSDTGRMRTAATAAALRQRSTGRTGTNRPDRGPQQRKRTRQPEEDHRSRITAFAIVGCSVVAVVAIIIFLIALSSGALFQTELVTVPNLVGRDYSRLDPSLLHDIKLADPEMTHDDSFAKNQIIHQTPSAGSKVAKGATVTIVVSLGPEPEIKTMDDLRGQKLEDAMAHLRGQGMNPLAEDECSDEVPEGKVIRTEPAAREVLTDGQTVYVYYSSGPTIKREKVPYVVGKSYDAARKELLALGFDNIEPKYVAGDEPKDEVVYQSVPAGTNLDLTEKIVLHVSEGPLDEETTPPETKPTQPEEPTKPEDSTQPELVTTVVSIPLPQDRKEAYVLTLYHSGKEVVEAREIQPGTPFIAIELSGRGIQMYELRINGSFYRMHEVDFTKHG